MQRLWAAVEAKQSEWTAQAGGAPGCRPRALPGAASSAGLQSTHPTALLPYICTLCLFLKMSALFTLASSPLSVREGSDEIAGCHVLRQTSWA